MADSVKASAVVFALVPLAITLHRIGDVYEEKKLDDGEYDEEVAPVIGSHVPG